MSRTSLLTLTNSVEADQTAPRGHTFTLFVQSVLRGPTDDTQHTLFSHN